MTQRGAAWVCILVVIATMFYGLAPMLAGQNSVYETFSPLAEVHALIQRRYVEAVNPADVVDDAVRGILKGLDPYCAYVAPGEIEAFQKSNTGEYIGVGVEIGLIDGRAGVIAPIEDGPAARAGVRAGDHIVAIDQQPGELLSPLDVEHRLSGEVGTSVELKLRRETGEMKTLQLRREKVRRRSVKGCRQDGNGKWGFMLVHEKRIGYIRVSQFSKDVTVEIDDALSRLMDDDVGALILDLRFNPGGLMSEAVALTDRFVARGTILSTVNRYGAVQTFLASPGERLAGVPLAVLINGSSASSSEIVAGALQDHGRAVIIGERSFGKGSVQDFIEIQDGRAGLRLTTAYYRLPSGRLIHRQANDGPADVWGVVPDVEVLLGPEETAAVLRDRHALDMGRGTLSLAVDPQLARAISVVGGAVD